MKIFLRYHQGFTLVEVVVSLIVISIGIISIISMMRVSVENTDKTRQDSLAINLAREGMEGVYTIRDTNWLRWSGKRDANRLCANPSLTSTNNNCGAWIQSGTSYVLLYTGSTGNIYPYLSGVAGQLDLTDAFSDNAFTLVYGTGINNAFKRPMRYQSGGVSPIFSEGKFYREIRGKGLFQKDINVNTVGAGNITCTQGSGTYSKRNWPATVATAGANCDDGGPKEFRFCSRVEYDKRIKIVVELCGIITNHKK